MQFNPNITITIKQRWLCTAGSSPFQFYCYPADLVASRMVALSTTGLYPLFSAVRLRKVEVWSPFYGSIPPKPTDGTATLTWSAANTIGGGSQAYSFNGNQEVSDTTLSTEAPSYISAIPPKNTQASFWNGISSGVTATATPLFFLVVNPAAVVDITYQVTLVDGVMPASVSVTGPANLSEIYGNFLDSVYSATGQRKMVPVGLAYIQ
jgi:hypothetical protein